MSTITSFTLSNNHLEGVIPSELGLLTATSVFRLGDEREIEGPYNNFTGEIPTNLWLFSNMKRLTFENLPLLRGRIFLCGPAGRTVRLTRRSPWRLRLTRGDAQPTDADLVEGCLRGESASWDALVERYGRLVYSVPARLGFDREQMNRHHWIMMMMMLMKMAMVMQTTCGVVTVQRKDIPLVIEK